MGPSKFLRVLNGLVEFETSLGLLQGLRLWVSGFWGLGGCRILWLRVDRV